MGEGRAEGSSAIGDGGQAAFSLMPDVQYQLHHRCFYTASGHPGLEIKILYCNRFIILFT